MMMLSDNRMILLGMRGIGLHNIPSTTLGIIGLSHPPHGIVMPMDRSMSIVPGYSVIKGTGEE